MPQCDIDTAQIELIVWRRDESAEIGQKFLTDCTMDATTGFYKCRYQFRQSAV